MTAPTNISTRLTNVSMADKYGALLAQAADLKKAINTCRDSLIELAEKAGESAIEGVMFRVTVTKEEVTLVDWKALAETLQPDPDLVAVFRTTDSRTKVSCKARTAKKLKKAA